MRTSSSARGVWSSHRMKATPAAAPSTRRSTMTSELQPSRWPSAIPVIRPNSPAHRRAKPSQSKGGMRCGMGRVGMNISPITAAIRQNGSEMKKT